MEVHTASSAEAKTLAQIIVSANRSVARQFALDRLAVLPEFPGQGMGKKLVDHIIDQAKKDEKKTISIIKAHLQLAAWYGALGFEPAGTKEFDHLPFDVQFMAYSIPHEGSR